MSNLVVHSGARFVGLDVLSTVAAPPATKTWQPISHGDMLNYATKIMSDFGLSIKGQGKYALSSDNQRMFAALDIEGHTDTNGHVGFAVGIRGSTNKTLAAAVCFGSRVFVCDNLAFCGELQISRRHTSGILADFPMMLQSAIGQFAAFRDMQYRLFENLRKVEISRDEAWAVVGAIYSAGGTTKGQIADIVELTFDNELHQTRHGKPTAWSLYNAYTENHKDRQTRNLILASEESTAMHAVFKARFDNKVPAIVVPTVIVAPAVVVEQATPVVETPAEVPAAEVPAVVVEQATPVVETPAAVVEQTTEIAPITADDAPF